MSKEEEKKIISENLSDSDKLKVLFKHIDILQITIKRMADVSFVIKGWTLTLISLFFINLSVSIIDFRQYFILFIVLGFWLLDTYYQKQERLFREIYKRAIKSKDSDLVNAFEMNTKTVEDKYTKFYRVFFSKTLLIYYLMLISFCIIIVLL